MTDEKIETLLQAGLGDLSIPAPEGRVRQLLSYIGLLDRWNRTYNLTAVRDPAEMVTKHILDSLAVLPWTAGGSLLDAGAGAGLPGIPLAIVNPALKVTLVDSAGKKVRFMNHAKRELGLANTQPVQARVESFDAEDPFGAIVSRAFSNLASFASAVRHLADADTRLLAMKGRRPDDELDALPAWVDVRAVEKLEVPGLHEHRHLVIMSVSP